MFASVEGLPVEDINTPLNFASNAGINDPATKETY